MHYTAVPFGVHCKYVQWNYSEDTTKNCKTELQFFYCNMDKYFAIHSTMQKCIFKFTVITLHLEQQSNVKNKVKKCKLDYSYSTVMCTFLSCVPYLQCTHTYIFLAMKNISFYFKTFGQLKLKTRLGTPIDFWTFFPCHALN